MTTVHDAIEAVKVHITATDVPFTHAAKRKRYVTECRTLVIVAPASTAEGHAVMKLLDQDWDREEFYLQPLDFDIVVCHSRAQAQGVGNAVGATTPSPDGAYIPKTNLSQSGPFKSTDDLWMVSVNNASPYPNRVSLIITRCVYE